MYFSYAEQNFTLDSVPDRNYSSMENYMVKQVNMITSYYTRKHSIYITNSNNTKENI